MSVGSLTDSRYSKSSSYILKYDIDDFQDIDEDIENVQDIENIQKVQDRDDVQEIVENVQDTEHAHCNKSSQNKRFSDIEGTKNP